MISIPKNPYPHLMYYLASPYTHKLASVREVRADRAARALTWLASKEYYVYAPVPHGHATVKHGNPGYHYWIEHGLRMITALDGVIVLMLAGWAESTGIKVELEHAKKLGKLILWLDPKSGFLEGEHKDA